MLRLQVTSPAVTTRVTSNPAALGPWATQLSAASFNCQLSFVNCHCQWPYHRSATHVV